MTWEIRQGDCLALLQQMPSDSVDCCVTSPPYFSLRDYGHPDQIGLEPTVDEFIDKLAAVFAEVKRVLKPSGVCWINIGDSYNGSGGAGGDYSAGGLKEGQPRYPGRRLSGLRPKSLIGVPWRLAFALMADGWILRSDVIWSKPAPMPESATDRPTRAHEYVFLLTKEERYFYDQEAIREPNSETSRGNRRAFRGGGAYTQGRSFDNGATIPNEVTGNGGELTGRNKRSVWSIHGEPFAGAHFATFPPTLAETCIKAGCPAGGVTLDPFSGAGTTCLVAHRLGRHGIGLELNPEYVTLANERIINDAPLFNAPGPAVEQLRIGLGEVS